MEKLNVYINKKAEARVLNNHPWVFTSDITKTDENIKNGDIVIVRNSKDKFFSESPTYFETMSLTCRTKNAILAVFAITFAIVVLPVPGGP